LKARVDLVSLAGKFTQLRRSGRQFVGLCPLHTERHASFYVHPGKQVFKCFGCGRGGDVFEFVMRATGCDLFHALQIVAEFSEGVASESEPRSGERFRAKQGGEAPSACEAGSLYSQSTQSPRARILAALDATNRRLRAIEAANRAASAALATACEPERGGSSYLLEGTE
jgi:DNA primase